MFGFLKKAVGNLVDKVKKKVDAKEELKQAVEEPKPEAPKKRPKGKDMTDQEIEDLLFQKDVKVAVPEVKAKAKKKTDIGDAIWGGKPKEEHKIKSVGEEMAEEKPQGLFGSLVGKLKSAITEKEIKDGDVKDILWNFQLELIQSNVASEVAEQICRDIQEGLVGKKVKKGADVQKLILDSLRGSLSKMLDNGSLSIEEKAGSKKPLLVMAIGFNGSGKTTTIARLGYLLQKAGLKCVFAAGDSFRAAAVEQLEVHGQRLGIKVVKQQYGADSAAVIFDAVKFAEAHGIDVVLADTAGRMHNNADLMAELEKVVRVNRPDVKLLVLDALTGSDIVQQSALFDKAVSIDGIIFTKVDVDEKGGAIISAAHTLKRPILYQGVGQEYGDLKEFKPEEFLRSLLG